MMRRLMLLILCGGLLCAQDGGEQKKQEAERLAYIRAHYTKSEHQIPMRDGMRLYTAVYAPKDLSQKYPILLNRTPYSLRPYGVNNYRSSLGHGEAYMREGFIFVYQDVRGRNRSEGEFVHVRPVIPPEKRRQKDIDESTDTYDTIEWLVKHLPNNNGRVGMFGISYPGFYAAMGAVAAHPALKATSPQAPVTEWFIGDDFRHNGALFLTHAFNFLTTFGRGAPPEGITSWPRFEYGTPDGYDFHLRTGALQNYDEKYLRGEIAFWKELLENDTYSEFWKSRDPRSHLKGITPAMLTVGGWFDAEDVFGPLRVYEAAERQGPKSANLLVMGPWHHGAWSRPGYDRLGDVRFHQDTSKFYLDKIEFPFFMHHLKEKGEGAKLPEAYMYETGRNEWHAFPVWPPKEAKEKTFFLSENGRLAGEKPAAGAAAFDEYISDPAKPVPFVGYITDRMTIDYMVADQRFAGRRPDVLVYETEQLENDLRLAGPLKVKLHVSVSGTDADFVVKVIDVYPNDYPDNAPNPANVRMGGYQQLLRGEPFRGKFRRSLEKPEPFKPGEMDVVEFEMPDIFHTFRRGHRLMVQVQSTWYPLVDRNPQKFMPIQEAKAADFVKATHRVYRSAAAPSALTVLTLD